MITSTNDNNTLDSSSMAADDAVIKEKIMQRGEIAKMTRQLKEKLFKAGLKVRDQSSTSSSSSASGLEYSQGMTSSPTKAISDGIFNNISATAINNIQNSKLGQLTPLRESSADKTSNGETDMTPIISPLKRRNGSFNEYDVSPSKKQMMLNSSPIFSNGSPYSNRALIQTPQSLSSSSQPHNQPQQPTTPPPVFSHLSTSKDQQQSSNSENLLATPQQQKSKSGNKNDVGADLLLYLLKSPANNNNGKTVVPTTPKLVSMSNGNPLSSGTTTITASSSDVLSMNLFGDHLNGTGVNQYSSNFSPSLMASGQRCPQTPTNLMNTPINRFQTPLTPKRLKGTPGFSLMDFINFSPNCARTPDLSNHEFSKLSNLNGDQQQQQQQHHHNHQHQQNE